MLMELSRFRQAHCVEAGHGRRTLRRPGMPWSLQRWVSRDVRGVVGLEEYRCADQDSAR